MRAAPSLALIAATLILAGCSSSTTTAEPVETAAAVAPTPVETPAEPETDPNCLTVDQSTIDAITAGLQGVTISTAAAYRSDDYEQVYFVAADLAGDGINPGDAVALFATNDDPTAPGIEGPTLAVGGFAHEFSDWGHGEQTDAQLSISDHGADEAQDCLGL